MSRGFDRCAHREGSHTQCSREAEVRCSDGRTRCREHAPAADLARWDAQVARLRARFGLEPTGGKREVPR